MLVIKINGLPLYTLYLNISLSKLAIFKCRIIIDNIQPWLGDAIAEEMVIFGCVVVALWPIPGNHYVNIKSRLGY